MADTKPGRPWSRRLVEWAAIAALSLVLLGLAELALRGTRWLRDAPTITRSAAFDQQIRQAARFYRRHPYLNTAATPSQQVAAFGKMATANSLGYRSPERPVAKGTTPRVVCAGGSTTFDIAADEDSATWPWKLQGLIESTGHDVEVWNAGFPGWTSLENLISLAQRDIAIRPDLVIVYQGINDLQPGSHHPFDPGYEQGHAEQARRALGLELPALRWSEHSLLLEAARDRLRGPDDPWQRLVAPNLGSHRLEALPEAAVATFRRNLQSIAGITQAHGIRLLLVSQPLRVRAAHRDADLRYLAGWLTGLEPTAAASELQRLNAVTEEVAMAEGAWFWDAAALPWQDEHFVDPMHFSAAGSQFFAQSLAAALLELGALPGLVPPPSLGEVSATPRAGERAADR